MRVVADLDLCQAHQMCQGEAPDVFGFDEDADQVTVLAGAPRRVPAAAGAGRRPLLPSHGAEPSRRTDEHRVRRSRSSGRPGSTSTGRPSGSATGRSWPTGTPRTRRTAGCTRPTSTSWPSAARRSGTRDRPGDGRPRRLALRLPVHDGRRGQRAWCSASGSRSPGSPTTPPARSTRSSASAARGSASSGRPDGSLKFAWQRDWFDLGSTATTFLAIAGSGKAPQGLLDRMSVDGTEQPGHYPYADLPSTLWPPPVERATTSRRRAHVTHAAAPSCSSTASWSRRAAARRTRSSTRPPAPRSAGRPTPPPPTSTPRSRPPGARSTRPTGRRTSSSGSAACASCTRRCSTTPTTSGRSPPPRSGCRRSCRPRPASTSRSRG